jgi:alkanesulfonate monooxygenase SsuD/methylene tetrahydromethanopterin reductase-like flavin-dependent oxidoreductase (luciferase family)
MKFGPFVLQVSPSPEVDSQFIDSTLREAELFDTLGYDVIWLTEHYFGGDTVYADPVVFGAAVAARTHRIKIGFAVVQMAFHHPVKLAAQTALLDNLSHGRLIVGTGRGSAYNSYEYAGFGITMEEGRQRLTEAEDLLVKSWTADNLIYNGKYWQVTVPSTRPRPYQLPHPPLVRSCIGTDSMIEMAKIGRPVLAGGYTVQDFDSRLRLYKDTMGTAGYNDNQIQQATNEIWFRKMIYVADSDSQALEEGVVAFELDRKHIRDTRETLNPTNYVENVPKPESISPDDYLIAGSPKYVAERIAEIRDVGVNNLILIMSPPDLSREKVERSMNLFAEKVMPYFRDN